MFDFTEVSVSWDGDENNCIRELPNSSRTIFALAISMYKLLKRLDFTEQGYALNVKVRYRDEDGFYDCYEVSGISEEGLQRQKCEELLLSALAWAIAGEGYPEGVLSVVECLFSVAQTEEEKSTEVSTDAAHIESE